MSDREIEKWRDGTDMTCSVCGQPIYTDQARYRTASELPKKRKAQHYFCAGGVVTIMGSPEPGVTEVTQYGKH
jgi:hypothetical protein